MAGEREYIELRCSECSWAEVCGPTGVGEWLRRARKLRAGELPEWEIMVEVLRAAAAKLVCPDCGATGLVALPADEGAGWPRAANCEVCGSLIPAERLAALPGATRCAACQRAEEAGRTPAATEFCPRCGAAMELKPSKSAGVTRYVMTCTANPPCRPAR
jgi:hypothetical protein